MRTFAPVDQIVAIVYSQDVQEKTDRSSVSFSEWMQRVKFVVDRCKFERCMTSVVSFEEGVLTEDTLK